jgi:cytochrome c-type protein NapC
VIAWALGLGAVVVLALLVTLRSSMRTRATFGRRVFTFVAMFALPALWFLGMFAYADNSMRKTTFCLSCHEMQPFGQSLTAHDQETLAAAHYMGGRSDREKACYVCHTKPGLAGYVDAKLRGIHDVKVHYLGDIPETLRIRGGYDVSICLDCHGPTENFREQPLHQAIMDDIDSGAVSCLDCHGPAHALPAGRAEVQGEVPPQERPVGGPGEEGRP